MAFQPLAPKRTKQNKRKRRVRRDLDGYLTLSTDCKSRTMDNGTLERQYTMRVTIPEVMVRMSKLKPGTRVSFEIDPGSRRCRIAQDDNGRWRITRSKAEDKFYLRIAYRDGAPTVAETEACHKPRIKPGSIEFEVPDSASFTRNLRADRESQPTLPGIKAS